ncbi:hypothetical protein HY636_05840 [Candidatus Woesearchaeota archaeon]|nr:hypothetical protein [Candidatus Woesearchaeota archaeon]
MTYLTKLKYSLAGFLTAAALSCSAPMQTTAIQNITMQNAAHPDAQPQPPRGQVHETHQPPRQPEHIDGEQRPWYEVGFIPTFESLVEKEFRKHGPWVTEFIQGDYSKPNSKETTAADSSSEKRDDSDKDKKVTLEMMPSMQELSAGITKINETNAGMIASFDPERMVFSFTKGIDRKLLLGTTDHELWHIVYDFRNKGIFGGPTLEEIAKYAESRKNRDDMKLLRDQTDFIFNYENAFGEYGQILAYFDLTQKIYDDLTKILGTDLSKTKIDKKMLKDFEKRKRDIRTKWKEYANKAIPLKKSNDDIWSEPDLEKKKKLFAKFKKRLDRDGKRVIEYAIEINDMYMMLDRKYTILGCIGATQRLANLDQQEKEEEERKRDQSEKQSEKQSGQNAEQREQDAGQKGQNVIQGEQSEEQRKQDDNQRKQDAEKRKEDNIKKRKLFEGKIRLCSVLYPDITAAYFDKTQPKQDALTESEFESSLNLSSITSTMKSQRIYESFNKPDEIMARIVYATCSLHYDSVTNLAYTPTEEDLAFLERFTYEGTPIFGKCIDKYILGRQMISDGTPQEEVTNNLRYATEFTYKGVKHSWPNNGFKLVGKIPDVDLEKAFKFRQEQMRRRQKK